MLEHKIDFMVTVEVREANANGDPLSGNMPRTNAANQGLISDVAIKRKIRNRMQDLGHTIFVQANDRIEDGLNSLEKRFKTQFTGKESDEEINEKANQLWMDVRSFGQVFTYLKDRSFAIRGPVSVSMAKSLDPIIISSFQILLKKQDFLKKMLKLLRKCSLVFLKTMLLLHVQKVLCA